MAIYSVRIDVSLAPPWAGLLDGILQDYFSTMFSGGSYYLGTINMSDAPTVVLPVGNVYFATQPNTITSEDNILALVANTSTGSPGILDFSDEASLLPSDKNAALYISNRCVLDNLIRPELNEQLNPGQSIFNLIGNISKSYMLTLNTTVNIDDDFDPRINSMTVYVNEIQQIQGDYSITGFPLTNFHDLIWVDITGSYYLTLVLEGQTISIDSDSPDGSGSLHLSWYGWLIVGGLIIASFGSLSVAVAMVIAGASAALINLLNFNISMSVISEKIDEANVSFVWPAQKACPINEIKLPGDMILYLDPVV
jgi:hypothetical protein